MFKLKAVESSHRREWSHWIEDENGKTVAAVVEDVTAPGRSNSLAANLAAAPDLLAACNTALMLRNLGGMLPAVREVIMVVVESAEAAIAKAKGGA